MADEAKKNGVENGHAKILWAVLAAVGAGLATIGGFGATLINRSMDIAERQIQVTADFKAALDRNTDAVEANQTQNAKANEWLEMLVQSQKEGFWRFFKYDDPEGMKPNPKPQQ